LKIPRKIGGDYLKNIENKLHGGRRILLKKRGGMLKTNSKVKSLEN